MPTVCRPFSSLSKTRLTAGEVREFHAPGADVNKAIAAEVYQSKTVIDACVASGIKHVVYSALEDFPDDKRVAHCSAKAEGQFLCPLPCPSFCSCSCSTGIDMRSRSGEIHQVDLPPHNLPLHLYALLRRPPPPLEVFRRRLPPELPHYRRDRHARFPGGADGRVGQGGHCQAGQMGRYVDPAISLHHPCSGTTDVMGVVE